MAILLAGDIGGTKTILRLVTAEGDQHNGLPLLTTLYEQTYPSHSYPDLTPMVRKFIAETADTIGRTPYPQAACFGIAGPVTGNTSKLTNLGWNLEANQLQQNLQIPQVSLINDFAAVGYGVLGLAPEDLHTLQSGQLDTNAPIGVIGAGTGLGEGYVVPCGNSQRVFPTEGGHADFAPRSTVEFQLLQYIKERQNLDRISVERVVSGMGIMSIYQFMRDRHLSEETPAVANAYRIWQQEIGKETKTIDLAAVISQNAIDQTDYICQETMELFIGAYGAEAGNFALKLLPYGGLYIAGGIAAKNLELMKRGEFMRAFRDKGRMSSLLERVPVHIVLNPRVGLIGAALRAAQL
jgi:glucokinase